MSSSSLLSIGDVAAATGLRVSAVRYYDGIGLISASERVGGKRRFDRATVARIRLIREAQAAGFSLDEITAMLDSKGDWNDMVAHKLIELTAHRDRLDGLIATLEGIRSCGCGSITTCERFDERFA